MTTLDHEAHLATDPAQIYEKIQDGKLTWLSNFAVDHAGNPTPETEQYLRALRADYGFDSVAVHEAMTNDDFEITGVPSGVEGQMAVYVDTTQLQASQGERRNIST